jgi:hypothetical protein
MGLVLRQTQHEWKVEIFPVPKPFALNLSKGDRLYLLLIILSSIIGVSVCTRRGVSIPIRR